MIFYRFFIILLLTGLIFIFGRVNGQDSLFTRKVINELTAPKLHGRGYVKGGDKKAAAYIRKQYKNLELSPAVKNYFQPFLFPVNTFPSAMKISIDGKKLFPGKDYIVAPSSSSVNGTFKIKNISDAKNEQQKVNLSNLFLLIDTAGNNGSMSAEEYQNWVNNKWQAAGLIFIKEKKLTWGVSSTADEFPSIHILREAIPVNAKEIKIDVHSKLIVQHPSQNVIGIIPGNAVPDSFIFVTAHYDHLGEMGKNNYFPGANDNASGVSMLLNLAKHFTLPQNRPRYTMVFICFAGEEAGLLGSQFFTENPVYPLDHIKFLLNLDLLGTGDDGLMVVNGELHDKDFALMEKINAEHHYLNFIGKRGKAKNSDHYYFTEKGVPAFFCYTLGGIAAYHDIYDKAETLPLTKYKEVFGLLCDFISEKNK